MRDLPRPTRASDLSRSIDARFGAVDARFGLMEARFNDIIVLIRSESARLEAVLRADIAKLEQRVERLESTGLIR
jgi:hypothetical protein